MAATHEQQLASLGGEIARVLDPLVPAGVPVALLDFPDAPNVGDSMIWLGTLAWLARRRLKIRYTCSNLTYSRAALARSVGNATILLTGGGNFGDLYPDHQELREAVLADFPGHRIVQLPQSLHFESPAALDVARRAFGAHPNVTIAVRDGASLAFAREHFQAATVLAPDMAFALGPLRRAAPAACPVLWLARMDKEARAAHLAAPAGVVQTDWLQDDRTANETARSLLTRILRRRPALRPGGQGLLSTTYEPAARERVLRGNRILSRGRVVVSDRLHAHVLALLLGIRHFALDNTYGKVRGIYDAWTHTSPLVTWCTNEAEALERARALAEEMEPIAAV